MRDLFFAALLVSISFVSCGEYDYSHTYSRIASTSQNVPTPPLPFNILDKLVPSFIADQTQITLKIKSIQRGHREDYFGGVEYCSRAIIGWSNGWGITAGHSQTKLAATGLVEFEDTPAIPAAKEVDHQLTFQASDLNRILVNDMNVRSHDPILNLSMFETDDYCGAIFETDDVLDEVNSIRVPLKRLKPLIEKYPQGFKMHFVYQGEAVRYVDYQLIVKHPQQKIENVPNIKAEIFVYTAKSLGLTFKPE